MWGIIVLVIAFLVVCGFCYLNKRFPIQHEGKPEMTG